MSAVAEAPLPIQMTDAAANKVKTWITEEKIPSSSCGSTSLAVYGFQYGFTFDLRSTTGIPWSKRAV